VALISIQEIRETVPLDPAGGGTGGGVPPHPEHINLDPPKPVVGPTTYTEYVARLQAACMAKNLPIDYVGTVWAGPYHRTTYPIYRVMIRRPSSNQGSVTWVAGLHGNEKGGPLGVLDFLENTYPAESRGAVCAVYPLCNPWGFDHENRGNGTGQDINRTFGVSDESSEESKVLLADMLRQPFGFLHTMHEDPTSTGFFVYNSDSSKRWLAERMVACATQHNIPISSSGTAFGGVVRIDGGIAPYNYTIYPPPVGGTPLEDYWLAKGTQHFCTETPMQADLWTRAKCNSDLMRLCWAFV
jgi:hypothetical protein